MRNDAAERFREYAFLELKRKNGELSVPQFARWSQLKRSFTERLAKNGRVLRSSVRIPTQVKVSFDSLHDLGECLITNLSQGGVFVASNNAVEIGTKLDLKLHVGDTVLDIPVQVASVNSGPKMEFRSGMGMQFLPMDEKKRKAVEQLYEAAMREAANRLE